MARKLRWAAKGKGKRGGARIFYGYVVEGARVMTDLSADEKKYLARLTATLKGGR